MEKYLKQYKTTIPGILQIVILLLHIIGLVDAEKMIMANTVLTGAGLLGAKDTNAEISEENG